MKRTYQLNIINVMADGRVLTYDEFMAQPFVVSVEKNLAFYQLASRVFDPNYYEKERILRAHKKAAERQKELLAQKAAIDKELGISE